MSIDVTSLSFSYGSREILHDLSFSIPDGCLVNVLGPNGVGKSTLFRCILGLSPHYSGTILVNGKDLRALSVRERAREISYIPQSHAPVYDYVFTIQTLSIAQRSPLRSGDPSNLEFRRP